MENIFPTHICIVGAGNVGLSATVDISQNPAYSVSLLTSKADLFTENKLYKHDIDKNITLTGDNINITNDYDQALSSAEIVLITLPTFLIKSFISKLESYNPKIILFIPGYGGKEYFCHKLLQRGVIISGLDRSPYVARLTDINHVNASAKKSIRVGCLGHKDSNISELIENLFSIPCSQVNNYLTVTFTPSNPILHTSRLCSLFSEATFETEFSRMIKFYAEWNNSSSELLLKMDNELMNICKAFSGIDLSGVIPSSQHYESKTPIELTNKISNIVSLHNIDSPMVEINGKYYIDKESRYFHEDFLHGLVILKAFADIASINTPDMDYVLKWYEKLTDTNILDKSDSLIFDKLEDIGIHQNYGIKTKEDVYNFYKK